MSDDPDRTVKETLTVAAERVKAGRPPAVAVAEAAQQRFGYTNRADEVEHEALGALLRWVNQHDRQPGGAVWPTIDDWTRACADRSWSETATRMLEAAAAND